MVTRYSELLDIYRIANMYKEREKIIITNLENLNYTDRIKKFAEIKSTRIDDDSPQLLDINSPDDDFAWENSLLLSHAESFRQMGESIGIELKPILLHYSEVMLFSFFYKSLIRFESEKLGHGLHFIPGKTLETSSVKIEDSGHFCRVIDAYSIFESHVLFSPFIYDGTENSFKENTNGYSYLDKPKISVSDIIQLRSKYTQQEPPQVYDMLDFLLLFIASNVARYRPTLWYRTITAVKTPSLFHFKQAFRRCSLIYRRILFALDELTEGHKPSFFLTQADILMESQFQ